MVVAARLRRSPDVVRVRTEGTGRSDRLLSLRALASDLGAIRLAVSAGRAVGGSVERNRARRRLREAVRIDLRSRATFQAHDLVLVARPAILKASVDDLRGSVQRSLDQLSLGVAASRARHR